MKPTIRIKAMPRGENLVISVPQAGRRHPDVWAVVKPSEVRRHGGLERYLLFEIQRCRQQKYRFLEQKFTKLSNHIAGSGL